MSKSVKFLWLIGIFISGASLASAKLFSDVPVGHWAWGSISWVSDSDLMTGPGDKPGTFDPAGGVNRAQLAAVMDRYNVFLSKTYEAKISALEKRIAALENQDNVGLSVENPIIDSDLTLAQALAGLSEECPAEVKDRQVLVNVHYYSFDKKIHQGQLVLDEAFASDAKEIFEVLLKEKFPIQSVIPVSKFGWSDEASMEANNTSAFNYRFIAGSTNLSNHAKGWAIDINPFLNPYIRHKMGEEKTIDPPAATYDVTVPGTLMPESPVVKKFKALGWDWGGEWSLPNFHQITDYQHFENESLKPV